MVGVVSPPLLHSTTSSVGLDSSCKRKGIKELRSLFQLISRDALQYRRYILYYSTVRSKSVPISYLLWCTYKSKVNVGCQLTLTSVPQGDDLNQDVVVAVGECLQKESHILI